MTRAGLRVGVLAVWAAACEGPAGPPGPAGAMGVMGTMGEPGAMGAKGDPGAPGSMGTKGDKGDPGPAGPMGTPGTAAAKGDPGPAGPQGPQGPAGPAGPAGPQGAAGPQGPTGATGAMGAKGDPGTPGTDGSKVTASIGCSAGLMNTPLSFNYNVVQFANGNVFASGAIRGTSEQASAAVVFSPAQNGYSTAPVFVVFDTYGMATAGWWKISLDRATLVTTIEFNDAELPTGKETWTLTADKCVSNTY